MKTKIFVLFLIVIPLMACSQKQNNDSHENTIQLIEKVEVNEIQFIHGIALDETSCRPSSHLGECKGNERSLILDKLTAFDLDELQKFSNLKTLILPDKKEWMKNDAKLFVEMAEKTFQESKIVIIYNSLTVTFEKSTLRFIDIHDRCESIRMEGFIDGVYSPERLYHARYLNVFPAYKNWEQKPSLIGEVLCDGFQL